MLVKRTLKGSMRLRSKPIRRKQPLSRDHLHLVYTRLPAAPSHDDLLLAAMLFTGFYGLLRLGEMAMPDNPNLRNTRKYSQRTSVEWIPEGFAFWLPTHKTDSTFEGSRVIIPTISDINIDPVRLFQRYLASRDDLFPFHPFLWTRASGKSPSRSWFIRRLRKLLPDTNFAGQSLRAGGATALAEDGISTPSYSSNRSLDLRDLSNLHSKKPCHLVGSAVQPQAGS